MVVTPLIPALGIKPNTPSPQSPAVNCQDLPFLFPHWAFPRRPIPDLTDRRTEMSQPKDKWPDK